MGFNTLIGSVCTRAKMTASSSRTFRRKMTQRKVTLPHAATVDKEFNKEHQIQRKNIHLKIKEGQ